MRLAVANPWCHNENTRRDEAGMPSPPRPRSRVVRRAVSRCAMGLRHAHRGDRHRLCRPGRRGLSGRDRPPRRCRRRRCAEGPLAATGGGHDPRTRLADHGDHAAGHWPTALHPRYRRGARGRRAGLHCGRHARRRERCDRPRRGAGRGPRDRRRLDAAGHDRRQVDGAGRHDRTAAAADPWRAGDARRGLAHAGRRQPRVPARRLGHRRFHAARSHRDRRARRRRRSAAARLRTLSRARRAGAADNAAAPS